MNRNREILLAFLHFSLIIIPIIYLKFGKTNSLIFILSAILPIVIFDYVLTKFPDLRKILGNIFYNDNNSNENFPSKFSWVLIAIFFNFLIFRKEIAITALIIFAFSVPIRSMISKNFIDEKKFFEDSLLASIVFFITTLMILICCGLVFHMRPWFYFFGIFTTFCITILRARPSLIEVDNNFLTLVGFSSILSFFDVVWNFNY